jgi:soluble lytic murein transglycosylase-like protein
MDKRRMNATIPSTKQGFYGETDLAGNRQIIANLERNYGKMIRESAYQNGIEPALVATYLFVESRGDINARNGNTYGLGQLSVATTANTIYNDYKQSRISPREEELLIGFLGQSAIDTIKKAKSDTEILSLFSPQLLYNPNFNILISVMYFRRCLDKSHTLGYGLRLDIAIFLYNAGYYKTIPFSTDVDGFLDASIPNTTKNYIKKVLGTNTPYPDAKQIFG